MHPEVGSLVQDVFRGPFFQLLLLVVYREEPVSRLRPAALHIVDLFCLSTLFLQPETTFLGPCWPRDGVPSLPNVWGFGFGMRGSTRHADFKHFGCGANLPTSDHDLNSSHVPDSCSPQYWTGCQSLGKKAEKRSLCQTAPASPGASKRGPPPSSCRNMQ